LAAVVLFDAIPTGWVSKLNSVGLIPLQRRYSDAVAAQRRSIPKCIDYSVGTPTLRRVKKCLFRHNSECSVGGLHFGIVRRCNCVKVGLADFLHFISHIFFDCYKVLVGFNHGALCAPVFLGSLTSQTGRCAPPPHPSQLHCIPQNKKIVQKQNASLLAILGPPGAYTFPLDHRGYAAPS